MNRTNSTLAVLASAALVVALLWFAATRRGAPVGDAGALVGRGAPAGEPAAGGTGGGEAARGSRQALGTLPSAEQVASDDPDQGSLHLSFVTWPDGAPLDRAGTWRLVSAAWRGRVVEFTSLPGGVVTVEGVDATRCWQLISLTDELFLSTSRVLPDSSGHATITVVPARRTVVVVRDRDGQPIQGASVRVATQVLDDEPHPDMAAAPVLTGPDGEADIGSTPAHAGFELDVWADGHFPQKVRPRGVDETVSRRVVEVSLAPFDTADAGRFVFDIEGEVGGIWHLAAIMPDESAGWDDESEVVVGRAALGESVVIPRAMFPAAHWVIRHADLRYTLNAREHEVADWSKPVEVVLPSPSDVTLRIEDSSAARSTYSVSLTAFPLQAPDGFNDLRVSTEESAEAFAPERSRNYRLPVGARLDARVRSSEGRAASATFLLTREEMELTLELPEERGAVHATVYSATPLLPDVFVSFRTESRVRRAIEALGGNRYRVRLPADAYYMKLTDRDGVRTGVRFLNGELTEDLEFSLPIVQAERVDFTVLGADGKPLPGVRAQIRPVGRPASLPNGPFGKHEVIPGRVVLQRENVSWGVPAAGGRFMLMLPRGDYRVTIPGEYGVTTELADRHVLSPLDGRFTVAVGGQHVELEVERLRSVELDLTAVETPPGAPRNWVLMDSESHWPRTFSGDSASFVIGEAARTFVVSVPGGADSRALAVEAGAEDVLLQLDAGDFE